jgi:AbiV family abortive infection protein
MHVLQSCRKNSLGFSTGAMPKLNAFRGSLAPVQVADGINHAASNALRLANDAETLLNLGRFPTACSLAALSIEEAGKASILRELVLARSDDEVRQTWKRYRSHTEKNVSWLLPQLAASGASKLADFRPLFKPAAEHPELLDQVKQLGFYTDCLGKAHWSVPAEVIDEGLARQLVRTAKLLAPKKNCTAREIELWVEHIGPVWKVDRDWMQQALVNWYGAMQKEGLATPGENRMEQFIKTGLLPKEASDRAD